MSSRCNNKNADSSLPLSERERAYFGPRTDKPPGSVAWCWQTILLMQSRWKQKTIDEAGFQALVEELRLHEAWNVVPPGQPYGSLDALLQAEIGYSEQGAKEYLLGHGGDRKSQQFQDYNCNLEKALQGNSARYVLNRLRRKRPDLAEAYGRGEYRSVHAAAKAAGWIKESTPLDELRRAWNKASDDERVQFFHQIPDSERALLLKALAFIEAPAVTEDV